MKRRIDPKVDCVFKAILGRKNNRISLIHFLNSVLKPDEEEKIKEVDILNPYNEQEYATDKLSIVDVKAKDEKGCQYQIEIQLTRLRALKQRILYTWSGLYRSLLESGDQYNQLRRTISIWLIDHTLFPEVNEHHLPFCLYNETHKLLLTDHMQIHIIQLPQWRWEGTLREELDRWMYLFTQGVNVDLEHPPEILQVKEMKLAMDTLKRFSEKEREYHLYESRRLAIMDEKDRQEYQEELEAQVQAQQAVMQEQQATIQTQQAKLEKEQIDKERERAEKERFLNLLRQHGIDPK